MTSHGEGARMQIGAVLKSNRTRQGIDIRTVEERTKIRTKYLRALENEDWEVLPGPAYAIGFLRTYAQFLGLDAEALVDEYRRQVAPQPTHPVADGVLERHRRPGEPPNGPKLGIVLAAAGAVGVVLLAVLGLTGGGDTDGERADRRQAREERRQARRQERRRERRREAQQRERQAASGQFSLRLVTEAAIHVCLIGDGERPLIDGQVLPAGSEERFEAGRFVLGFPSGYDVDQFRLFVGGERERLPEAVGPTAYRIGAPGRIRPAPPPGPGCP